MRAHYLQHVPFEGLGSMESWLQEAGYDITRTRFHEQEPLPNLEEVDLLIIMGGPMSVNDEQCYPWLAKEKQFIKSVIQAGIPTLGICLGAQLIANSMGAEVFPNSVKEIGWFPVQAVKSKSDAVYQFPEETTVFHWHGETFSLPAGAILLAESKGCKNQAFQMGVHVIGLQFHLETTADSAQAMVENCRDELVDGAFIQTEEAILSAPQERYGSINNLMGSILTYLHKETARC